MRSSREARDGWGTCVCAIPDALSEDDLERTLAALPALEKASGVPGLKTVASAAKDAGVRKFLEAAVERECNAKVARYQTIKKIDVLEDVFSVDGGELTPTLKVKRNVVNEKYADHIAKLYGNDSAIARA